MIHSNSKNINECIYIYAGNSFKQSFKVYNVDGNDNVNLSRAYKIQFKLCRYGEFNAPLLSFTNEDIYIGKNRIEIDDKDHSIMHIYFYTNDTDILEESYYIYQIILLSYTGEEDAVMAEGIMYIMSKIQ